MPKIRIKSLYLHEKYKNMILNIEIKNYRSFKKACMLTMEANSSKAKIENVCNIILSDQSSIDILKSSIIFGANASGKTNIIRFLYQFKKLLRSEFGLGDSPVFLYDPFIFDSEYINHPSEFTIDFIIDNVKYSYSFIYDRMSILEEKLIYYPNGRPALLFEREIMEDRHLLKIGSSLKKVSFEVFKNRLLLSKFAIDTPHNLITPAAQYLSNIIVIDGYLPTLHVGSFDSVVEWILQSSKNEQRLSQLLEYADTGIKSFKIKENPEKNYRKYDVKAGHALYKNKDNTQQEEYLPIYEESYGTRSLFILGGTILQALDEGLPIFVDEIDSGLHTYITKFLTDLFRNERINSKNAQLILTTHDVNLLDQDTIRRDQIWFTEKDEYGCSELFSLSDFEDVREDTPFSKWYLNDKFGAVPYLKSIEKLF
jgi:hypothetical protein